MEFLTEKTNRDLMSSNMADSNSMNQATDVAPANADSTDGRPTENGTVNSQVCDIFCQCKLRHTTQQVYISLQSLSGWVDKMRSQKLT